jgi:uncharacterized integral membrane protein
MTSPDNSADQVTAAAAPDTEPSSGQPGVRPQHGVRRTRAGGVWVASALFAIVLLLLLIFILENSQRARISFFGAHGQLPLGVALLLAAVFGVLLVVVPGTARIVQLRRTARRHRKADAQAAAAAPAPASGTAPAAGSDPGRTA